MRIYKYVYTKGINMTHIARVFQSGNSQAVRLPKEFRLSVDRVEITQEGDALILRPHSNEGARWGSLQAALARGVSKDFLSDGLEQPQPETRMDLDDVFR